MKRGSATAASFNNWKGRLTKAIESPKVKARNWKVKIIKTLIKITIPPPPYQSRRNKSPGQIPATTTTTSSP
jgi:hypothetical protein